MKRIISSFKALTNFERKLYITSLAVVILSYIFSNGQGFISMIASCIGVTALIFIARGNVLGRNDNLHVHDSSHGGCGGGFMD